MPEWGHLRHVQECIRHKYLTQGPDRDSAWRSVSFHDQMLSLAHGQGICIANVSSAQYPLTEQGDIVQ